MSNQVNSMNKGLTVKDLVTTGIFTALLFVFVLVGGVFFATNPVLTFFMPDMDIVCEGSKELLNQYGVIAVNPEKYPDVNNEAANTFIKWICSPEIQTLIGEYGVKEYGEPLFFPNAEQK